MFNVYKITNSVNDKIYIGVTKNKLFKRFASHRYKAKHNMPGALYNSMRKNGINSFSIHILEECKSEKEMYEREKYWIDYYKKTRS